GQFLGGAAPSSDRRASRTWGHPRQYPALFPDGELPAGHDRDRYWHGAGLRHQPVPDGALRVAAAARVLFSYRGVLAVGGRADCRPWAGHARGGGTAGGGDKGRLIDRRGEADVWLLPGSSVAESQAQPCIDRTDGDRHCSRHRYEHDHVDGDVSLVRRSVAWT